MAPARSLLWIILYLWVQQDPCCGSFYICGSSTIAMWVQQDPSSGSFNICGSSTIALWLQQDPSWESFKICGFSTIALQDPLWGSFNICGSSKVSRGSFSICGSSTPVHCGYSKITQCGLEPYAAPSQCGFQCSLMHVKDPRLPFMYTHSDNRHEYMVIPQYLDIFSIAR